MEDDTYTRIRLLSVLAMLLLFVMCIAGALLIIANPGLTLLYAIATICLVVGGWIMLSAKGLKLWWGVGLTSLALLIVVIATGSFLSDPKNVRRLAVFAIASALYAILVAFITQQYLRGKRVGTRIGAAKVSKPVLIINPKSGNGRAMKAHLSDRARQQGIAVIEMQPGQNMVQLAEDAISEGATVIGISGGDGSLGVVAKISIAHNIPMVVLPGGTRCHFARDIGLDPAHITDALAGFYGIERRVDVGTVEDRIFLNNASFGLYAEITSHEEYRDHKIETSRRVMHELASSNKPYYPISFSDETGRQWDHAALVLIGVNRYETLHLGELGERKRMDEGVLQVVALRALDDAAMKQLASPNNRIGSGATTSVAEWTTSEFTISNPSGWLEVGLDGESLRIPSPAKLRILPRALRLIVPVEGLRHRPNKPVSVAEARTLWRLITTKQRYGT